MTDKALVSEVMKRTSLSESTASIASSDFEALYREHRDDVASYVRRQCGDGPPDPEDVTQLAFQKVLEAGKYRSIKNFRAYVRQAARNLFLMEVSRAQTRERYEHEVEHLFFPSEGFGSDPETVLHCRNELETINAALESMSPKQRRAFVLHRIDGLSITETGRRMRISRTAAAKHISRAIEIIDEILARRDASELR